MTRGIERRLQRLERLLGAAEYCPRFEIHFVDPQKGVVRTLLLGEGERIWSDPPSSTASEDKLTTAAQPFGNAKDA